MAMSAPEGITPPAPGLEREEPEFNFAEDDIPRSDDGWRWATSTPGPRPSSRPSAGATGSTSSSPSATSRCPSSIATPASGSIA